MIVRTYVVGPLSANCYLVTCEKTGRSTVIDPGGVTHTLLDDVRKYDVESILLTHGHFDHIAGAAEIAGITGAPIRIHGEDAGMLGSPRENCSPMIGENITAPEASGLIGDGDTIMVGESSLRVIHTPGHTPGGVTFVGDTFVLSGDTLFRLSVGRWDLPNGDYNALMTSIAKYRDLADDMILYPGHGEPSTIGFERKNNKFMNGL